MKKHSWLLSSILLALSSVFIISCDDDFNALGADLLNEDYLEMNKFNSTDISAGSFQTGPVPTANMPINSLGVFQNPITGKLQSHVVAQVTLDSYAPEIGVDPIIDSVYLYIPYFSAVNTTEANGQKTYKLDSIYGGNNKFDLKILESGYYLNTIDPTSVDGNRVYYSDEKVLFDNQIVGTKLNDSPLTDQNSEFYFKNEEKYIYKRNATGQLVNSNNEVISNSSPHEDRVIIETIKPGIWLDLNKPFFSNKVLNTNSANLASANAFLDHFRGIYFQTTQLAGSDGALAKLDFSAGYIQIKYNVSDGTERVSKSLKLNFKGQRINLFENQLAYTTTNPERLYVNGGGLGSEATSSSSTLSYIDLFNEDLDTNGVPDLVERIKQENWLVNDASITIYVDRDAVGNNLKYEPVRLFLYDLKNNAVLNDYTNDTSTNTSDPSLNKGIYNGILVKQDGKGLYYKFRITEYLKSLVATQTEISADDNRYRLGLSVAESITEANFVKLKTPVNNTTSVPRAAVMSTLGTVLHSPLTSDSEKKIKFEIYYTTQN